MVCCPRFGYPVIWCVFCVVGGGNDTAADDADAVLIRAAADADAKRWRWWVVLVAVLGG